MRQCDRPLPPVPGSFSSTTLYPLSANVSAKNEEELDKLDGDSVLFNSIDGVILENGDERAPLQTEESYWRDFPCDAKLSLKPQVVSFLGLSILFMTFQCLLLFSYEPVY